MRAARRAAGLTPGSPRMAGSSATHSRYRSSRAPAGRCRHARAIRYSPMRSSRRSPLIPRSPGPGGPGGPGNPGGRRRPAQVPAGPPRRLRRSAGSTSAAAARLAAGVPPRRGPASRPPAGPAAGTGCRFSARPPSSGHTRSAGPRGLPGTPVVPAPAAPSSSCQKTTHVGYIYRLLPGSGFFQRRPAAVALGQRPLAETGTRQGDLHRWLTPFPGRNEAGGGMVSCCGPGGGDGSLRAAQAVEREIFRMRAAWVTVAPGLDHLATTQTLNRPHTAPLKPRSVSDVQLVVGDSGTLRLGRGIAWSASARTPSHRQPAPPEACPAPRTAAGRAGGWAPPPGPRGGGPRGLRPPPSTPQWARLPAPPAAAAVRTTMIPARRTVLSSVVTSTPTTIATIAGYNQCGP